MTTSTRVDREISSEEAARYGFFCKRCNAPAQFFSIDGADSDCVCEQYPNCKRSETVEVDIRKHEKVREQVHAGIAALRVQGRQIWGFTKLSLSEIVIRLSVGVGDLSRVSRDGHWLEESSALSSGAQHELKKELGNIIFSTIRWIDDLGLDPLECLDLAISAQENYAQSGRRR